MFLTDVEGVIDAERSCDSSVSHGKCRWPDAPFVTGGMKAQLSSG